MKQFIDYLGKYTNVTYDDFVNDALQIDRDAINDDIIDDLITEIETAHLIKTDSVVEPNIDLENLREWLKMYYKVDKK